MDGESLVSAACMGVTSHAMTFHEYHRFCSATGREVTPDEAWGRGNRPVISVDWEDAGACAEWLSAQTGSAHLMRRASSRSNYAAQRLIIGRRRRGAVSGANGG